MIELILIGVSIAAAIGALYMWPEATTRWFKRIAAARAVLFGVFSLLMAIVLIGTGSTLLVLSGMALLAFISLAVVIEFDLY